MALNENFRERYRAVHIGTATGDILGIPVEGWKAAQIKRYVPGGRIIQPIAPFFVKDSSGNVIEQDEFGKLKYYSKDLKKGDYSDDTILTLALTESIVECRSINLNDIAKRQLREYEIRVRPDGSVIGGFGGTTMEALKRLKQGVSPLESGIIGGPGNGPAMKMAPLGIYMHITGSYEKGIESARAISRITHLDPRSVVSGIVQAHAVYCLLNGTSKDDFISSALEVSKKYEEPLTTQFALHDKGSFTSRLEWISKNKDATVEEALSVLGNTSLVFKSHPFALFMFQKYWDNPIEGLLELVNTGGDCDTTGAIYGALVGAKDGMIFPKEWVDVIQNKERIIKLADGLYDLR